MSKTKNTKIRSRQRPAIDLARLLDAPALARAVPHLAPETLHHLVRECGLEACGALLTSATPAQLTALLDLDLWRQSTPGLAEQFDADRFGEWLEVLVDAGESVAARTVANLGAEVVVTGLSRYVRVFDPGTLEPAFRSDDEPADRYDLMNNEPSASALECEVGGYLVRSRQTHAWDAIVALLVTLDAEHNHYFHVLMQACRRASNSAPEIDGLDELPALPDQQLFDLTVDRERRRSRLGYAMPGDARAFLQMARGAGARGDADGSNPIAVAYFRSAEAGDNAAGDAVSPSTPEAATSDDSRGVSVSRGGESTSMNAVVQLLAEAGVTLAAPRALLGSGVEDSRAASVPLLNRQMEYLLDHAESAYVARNRELAFLANTLQAGCSVQLRPFTPQEAWDGALCTCNLGLEFWTENGMLPDRFLMDRDLVAVFEVGWSALHREVSMFAADQLLSMLTHLRSIDVDVDRSLRDFERQLAFQRDAGTPWLARGAADVIAELDLTAWVSVLGLLDECPICPAALTAVLERRTTSVSATAFQFFSTRVQIRDVHAFMDALPRLLH